MDLYLKTTEEMNELARSEKTTALLEFVVFEGEEEEPYFVGLGAKEKPDDATLEYALIESPIPDHRDYLMVCKLATERRYEVQPDQTE